MLKQPALVYNYYERRLAAELDPARMPRHVGVILDGNRRWAKTMGFGASQGHQRGADKIEEFLGWAEAAGVRVVTLWLLSTDNLSRDPAELAPLLEIISQTVESLASSGRWDVRLVGSVDLLPSEHAARLRRAVEGEQTAGEQQSAGEGAAGGGITSGSGGRGESAGGRCAASTSASTSTGSTPGSEHLQVNIAVGYGGRQEIADAVRAILRERAASGESLESVAESLSEEDITEHLYTKGQPDPDLVIRTSGEQRLSGFLLWQSVHSEFYFCEVYWPDFRRIDFLRALRDFSHRERRLGK